jgi:hypothetical protein
VRSICVQYHKYNGSRPNPLTSSKNPTSCCRRLMTSTFASYRISFTIHSLIRPKESPKQYFHLCHSVYVKLTSYDVLLAGAEVEVLVEVTNLAPRIPAFEIAAPSVFFK